MPASIVSIPGFADPVSAFTHLGGAAVFGGLGLRLVWRGRRRGWHAVGLGIFAFSCVLLLAASGVFHLLGPGPGRSVMQRIDHAAIFVLIAGTFTPIHAMLFRGFLRWGVLAFIWSAAATGIALKTVYFQGFPEWLGVVLYLGLGWIGGVSMIVLWRSRGFAFGQRMVYAGLAYTCGAAVELLDWPTLLPGVVGPHELFHVFVLIGAGFFWAFIEKIERLMPRRGATPEPGGAGVSRAA